MIKLVKAVWAGLLAGIGLVPEDCKPALVEVFPLKHLCRSCYKKKNATDDVCVLCKLTGKEM